MAVCAGVVCSALLALPVAASAAGCPNEQLRVEDGHSLALPDCRAYEQVSPVEKNAVDVAGAIWSVRGAPSGEAVTFDSLVPLLGTGGSSQTWNSYMATRGSQGWSTQNLEPQANPGWRAKPTGATEGLSRILVESHDNPPLAPGGIEDVDSTYLQSTATGAYELVDGGRLTLVGASAGDSRIFLEENDFLEENELGIRDLYEWHEGRLSLVATGAIAGGSEGGRGGADERFYLQGAVSEGGSLFFTDLGSGQVLLHEPQAGKTVAVSAGQAVWQAATPDGSSAFYLEGGGLYRFDVQSEAREALVGSGAGVVGVLGVGGDGSYVYFAATGVLAHGALPGGEERTNLYVWHEGTVSFIAGLQGDNTRGDVYDWTTWNLSVSTIEGPDTGGRSSRVSADGRTLMFTSRNSLTGYDNAGQYEVYLYSVATGRVLCVSCDPRTAIATGGGARLYLLASLSPALPPELLPLGLPRNLSADGNRVFFETSEALVPQDTNGAMDVYEWEREGTGSCPVGRGGCLYLISSGESGEPSYFAEASTDGSDVFFFTRQSLVGQDSDELVDVYDARVGGGIALQNPPAEAAACGGEACRGAPGAVPQLSMPASQMSSGLGNLMPSAETVKPKSTHAKPKPKAKKKKRKSRKPKRRARKSNARSEGR
jgi:hypothetical protein